MKSSTKITLLLYTNHLMFQPMWRKEKYQKILSDILVEWSGHIQVITRRMLSFNAQCDNASRVIPLKSVIT